MNPIEPDQHLQVALRHAPDADTKAPPELTAHILAAAHRSAAERPSPVAEPAIGWRTKLMAWWRMPQAHAAMASVLLAGVVGLLWRDEQPGPGLDREPVPVAQAPLETAPLPPLAPQEAPKAESRALGKAEKLGSPEKDARDRQRQTRASQDEQVRTSAAPNSAALMETVAADKARQQDADRANGSPESARAPLPAAPVAAAMPAPSPSPSPSPAPAAATAPNVQLSAAATNAPTAAASPPPTSTPSVAAAPPARTLGAPAHQPAVARRALLPQALEVMSLDGWTWQAGSTLRHPEPVWMNALLQPAQSQWRPVGDAQPITSSLRLERSAPGELPQQIWLEPDSLLWCVANRGCQRAPLPPQRRQALLDELAR